MLIPQPLNLLIRINTIILQSNKVLPTIKIQHRPQNLSGSQLRKRGVLLMLMFDLLGRAILFLFLFLNSSFKRKNQLNSGILRNIVGYQVVFSPMRNLAWAAAIPFLPFLKTLYVCTFLESLHAGPTVHATLPDQDKEQPTFQDIFQHLRLGEDFCVHGVCEAFDNLTCSRITFQVNSSFPRSSSGRNAAI
jgi:hypothetical protein